MYNFWLNTKSMHLLKEIAVLAAHLVKDILNLKIYLTLRMDVMS